MLKAARDRVENLMQVAEKMQTQQTLMSMHLHAEKRKVASVRYCRLRPRVVAFETQHLD